MWAEYWALFACAGIMLIATILGVVGMFILCKWENKGR